ncbi:hypothetical protein ASPWEDRAFT_117672 [Aspergillus wentii DTO 134E9]|uniref:Methyltransferase domain-containing protein n=1 Tax=Aspergillus wentii DTO 134E9 TaxID=1073089 RepID=A0A1L9RCC7_ASPWE|nr:uncharacterized protein ASPWEDRAFT_117672 [Aspergillus wentii DTO 134E9]KAI9935107.1 hypothetical protein MW887_000728 [Aspergillus wentii]OJJ32548.1 hypothetical protein ASPWEDRAFT_117672 [Aspergillus wentii DTO 134E9]
MSQTELVRSIYNERSAKYDASFHVLLAEEYIRIAQPKQNEKVLDLACGTGLVTFLAAEKVGPNGLVVGVDISDGMLDVARSKDQNGKISFIRHDISDLTKLDLPSEGFDLITCAAALVLLPDPLKAIRHWATFLTPGGRLVTDVAAKDVHVPSRILSGIGDQIGQSLQWDQSWVQGENSLYELLERAGLRVKTVFTSKTFQVREYHVDTADEAFEQVVSSPMFRNFGDPSIKDEAKRLFIERFREEAGPVGVLLDEAKMYFGVAYKHD